MDKLYIVIPAYNESENIKNLVKDWYPVIEKYNGDGKSRLVIINDGSKDDTYKILQELAETRPLMKPLTKSNEGHGPTVLYGYLYAVKNKADFVFQTDSDGQTEPNEFEQFWAIRNQYDAIVGDRSNRQDGLSRKFVESTLLFILRCMFGVKIPDSNAPFRLIKRELLERYIDKMPKNFNLPNVMLTTYFAYFHEKVTFLPITFKPRQGGSNSINIQKIVKIGWQALGDFRMLKKQINYGETQSYPK